MAGIIPQEIIEQVRQANDIVAIINQYMRLKKRGRNFLALCPFHNEKTPSFSVSQDKQIYHCFGCGKGGNVFTFLMEHENMTFVEAVRHLAAKAGIVIPERKIDDSRREEIERLHYAHQTALEYFQKVLYSSKYKDQVLDYLHIKRRLNDETINLFQLGLAGEEWDGFLSYALKKELFPKELVKAGLVIYSDKKDNYFDRFRQRLMIPIFNLSDKPIAFGGRALKKGDPAKYINSPETPLYSKSNVLYGLNFTRHSIRKKNEVIIVEGYFDLISLYQIGIRNVVASSGTAFTTQQARFLARFTDMAYLFFDADSAGQTAALRSVDALYDAGMEVMVMIPPEGEDPDTTTQKGGLEKIEEIKENALRFLEFRVKEIDIKKSGIIAKEKLIKELAELSGRIEDKIRRQLFMEEAAETLQVNIQNFLDFIPKPNKSIKTSQKVRSPKKIADIERDLISLIIGYPEYIDTVNEKLHIEDFQNKSLGDIYSLVLSTNKKYGAVSVSGLIDLLEDKSAISELITMAEINWPDEYISAIIHDIVDQLLNFKRDRIIDKLKGELKIAEKKKDLKTAKKLESEILDLIKRQTV